MTMRTIEIDFEVHKAIELERRSFDETPTTVLRRLLGIEPAEAEQDKEAEMSTALSARDGGPWVGKGKSAGLTLAHGTELRMHYNDQRFTGRVDNGALVIGEKRFSSPSAAARGLCRTKKGSKTSLNGKELIDVRLPGEADWVLLKTYQLRRCQNEIA